MTDMLRLDGWAGRIDVPVEVVGETRTKYRITLLVSAMLPGRRLVERGETVLVPKHAVRREGKDNHGKE